VKCILLIIDGLGDLPSDELGGDTPLEAAHTPVLDRMAAAGSYGLIDPIAAGEIPNTHSGVGILFGMKPGQTNRLRRGPVEAAGLGLPMKPGDIALRANFATVDQSADGLLVRDRRAGRISQDTAELAIPFKLVQLGDGITASLRNTDQHRAVLLLSGPGLDSRVSDTDPGDIAMPALLAKSVAQVSSAGKTAEKINTFVALAHRELSAHPLNLKRIQQGKLPASGIITRGAGATSGFNSRISDAGISTALVSGCNTVKGLGRLFGFDIISDKRFTADRFTDLDAKVEAVITALASHDLVYLHIKAPDLFSHDHQPRAKKEFLERMDGALGPLLRSGAMIAVSADHTTNSNTGAHTADPVPALLYIPGQRTHQRSVYFGERWCKEGNLPRQPSSEFLQNITEIMSN